LAFIIIDTTPVVISYSKFWVYPNGLGIISYGQVILILVIIDNPSFVVKLSILRIYLKGSVKIADGLIIMTLRSKGDTLK
jgi:hypothetical protein